MALVKLESRVHSLVDDGVDLGDEGISLLLQNFADVDIIDVLDDHALHHGGAVVVLDVPFPASLRHVMLLVEALLLEELNRVVISIGQEVLQTLLLRVVLQLIHQARAETPHLFRGSDSEEDNLGKALGAERPKDAATDDLGPLALLTAHDDHGFVLAVHRELDDVLAGHARELLGNDILQVNQMAH